jgi:hypothetical protein
MPGARASTGTPPLDKVPKAVGPVDLNAQKITNLAAGAAASDALRFDQLVTKDLYDIVVGNPANAWVVPGPISPGAAVLAGTGTASSAGQFVRVVGTAIGNASYQGALFGPNPGTDAAAAWTAGDKLELAYKMKVTGFAGLAANQLTGLEVSALSPTMSKIGNAARICVGVDNGGKIFVVAGSGAGITATDTGIVAVSGTAFKVKLVFVQGTSVVVTIDANAPTTVNTTLPTEVSQLVIGTIANAVCTTDFYSGAWRFTSA